jgi:hypothetical protein
MIINARNTIPEKPKKIVRLLKNCFLIFFCFLKCLCYVPIDSLFAVNFSHNLFDQRTRTTSNMRHFFLYNLPLYRLITFTTLTLPFLLSFTISSKFHDRTIIRR